MQNIVLRRGKTIKVCHIISGDLWAGAEVQVFNTLSSLSRMNGIDLICVLFNDGILRGKIGELNIKTEVLDENRFNSLSILFRLKKILLDFNPDLIHVHKVKEHFLGRLVSHLYLKGVPVVRTVHGDPKILGYFSLFKYLRSGFVVTIDKYLIRNSSDAVIAVSKELEKIIKGRSAKGKVFQINNAVEIKSYDMNGNSVEIRKKYGASDRFWIGTAARLVKIKNIPMLIEAGKHLAELDIPFKISIFGNGPLRGHLQDLIKKNALNGKVVLEGFEQNILPIIKSMDVFVLTSNHEGLPMALLEAMLVKTPLVCTAVGGMGEVIEDGVNGMLVPPSNSNKLAESLVRIYEDRDLAGKFAENGRKVIEEKYSLSETAGRLCDVYNELSNNIGNDDEHRQ